MNRENKKKKYEKGSVSYTHLDVYKRQLVLIVLLVALSAALAVRGPSRRIRRLSIVETIHAE